MKTWIPFAVLLVLTVVQLYYAIQKDAAFHWIGAAFTLIAALVIVLAHRRRQRQPQP